MLVFFKRVSSFMSYFSSAAHLECLLAGSVRGCNLTLLHVDIGCLGAVCGRDLAPHFTVSLPLAEPRAPSAYTFISGLSALCPCSPGAPCVGTSLFG